MKITECRCRILTETSIIVPKMLNRARRRIVFLSHLLFHFSNFPSNGMEYNMQFAILNQFSFYSEQYTYCFLAEKDSWSGDGVLSWNSHLYTYLFTKICSIWIIQLDAILSMFIMLVRITLRKKPQLSHRSPNLDATNKRPGRGDEESLPGHWIPGTNHLAVL